jgi:hypothetical protein
VIRRHFRRILLAAAVAAAASGCAATRGGGAVRQVHQALPAPGELPDHAAERSALADAQAQEAAGDQAGAAHEQARSAWAAAADRYVQLASSGKAPEWKLPLRHRAAELYLRAQRWDSAAQAAQAIAADAEANAASRAVAARLVATAWLGAATAAVKAGQLENLDLGPGRKGPRPVPAPWTRFREAADAYLAQGDADPDLRRSPAARGTSAAELALAAADVQYAYGDLPDARRRLEAALERWAGDPDLLEQAVPLYLATFLADGDLPGHEAAAMRLRERIAAEAANAPASTKAALGKVLEALGRARAGARFAAGEDLLRAGKAADAARAFEAAAEHGAPDAANALHNAGVAWDQAGDAAKAAAIRERLLREHPDAAVTAEDALRLAAFRARQRDHVGAARLYEEFLRRWPASASRCLALRNAASELDRAEQGADAAARYLAFGTDERCAKADPNIAARALVRAGRLSETLAKTAFSAAVALEGVTDEEARTQVADAKRRLKGL